MIRVHRTSNSRRIDYPKLFEILEDLNKNREQLLLLKTKMKEHSDRHSVLKVGEFVEKFLNEKY